MRAGSPGVACTWPWFPGLWRRAGQRRDLSGTFPGVGGGSLSPPPASAQGPHGPQPRPRALAGSGSFYCANAVARGSAHLWVRGIPRPISGTWPGKRDPAGLRSPLKPIVNPALSRIWDSAAPVHRVRFRFTRFFPPPASSTALAAPAGTRVLRRPGVVELLPCAGRLKTNVSVVSCMGISWCPGV